MANRIQQISSQIISPPRVPSADEMQYMCRICSHCDVAVNVFSDLGKLLNLEQKIKTCLRLELNEAGPYPNLVCMNCLGKVNISYELNLVAASTHEKITAALARLGIPTNNQGNSFQAISTNGMSPNKCNPVIESVQSLVSSPQILPSHVPNVDQKPSMVSSVNHIVRPPKPPSTPSPLKRVVSPDETPSKKERKTVCSTCGEWFFKSELAAHTKQAHTSVKLVFGCVNCSSNFHTQDELMRHLEKCL